MTAPRAAAMLKLTHVLWQTVVPRLVSLDPNANITVENVDMLILLGEALFPLTHLIHKKLEANKKWGHIAAIEAFSVGATKMGLLLFNNHLALIQGSELVGQFKVAAIERYCDHCYTTAAERCPYDVMLAIDHLLSYLTMLGYGTKSAGAYAFVAACRNGNLEVVQKMFPLTDKPGYYNSREEGFAAAAERGQVDVLKFLFNYLTVVSDAIDVKMAHTQTTIGISAYNKAFVSACEGNHLAAAKFLHAHHPIAQDVVKAVVGESQHKFGYMARDVLKWLTMDVLIEKIDLEMSVQDFIIQNNPNDVYSYPDGSIFKVETARLMYHFADTSSKTKVDKPRAFSRMSHDEILLSDVYNTNVFRQSGVLLTPFYLPM
jgi:hypothetical protein